MREEVYSVEIQSCPAEVAPKEFLFQGLTMEFGGDITFQLSDIVWRGVGKAAPLGRCPNVFHRIEFWRIGRQSCEARPAAAENRQRVFRSSVGAEVIPDDNQLPLQLFPQIVQEPHEIFGLGVMIQQAEE